MASTGVLPFVRGIDFSRNDFSSDLFPSAVADMTGLRWMKLNRANLERVPEELSQLKNLEHLQMVRNGLTSVHGELSDLPCLRSVIVRHNNIKTSGIPTDVFDMKDLTIVDFSHNSLKEVPPNLDHAKCAIVLNLSHNVIETIPNQLFVNMIDLLHLDLSHNKLEMLPPQIRRLTELQALILNDNPLQHFQLKQLPSMTQLRVLHMKNTQRNASNIPPSLDNLVNLEDVDVSMNELTEVPDAFFKLKNLRKLNLSDNQIEQLVPFCESCWESLVVLNMSRNKLKALPDILVRMTKLKKLLVNDNELTFDGIPSGIGKLVHLEVFHAAFNNLELVPEGLCRCVNLKRLKLNNNRLITMPDSIHYLTDLTELDVRNNPDLVMPPKPMDYRRKMQYYNIDFSLNTQRALAGAGSPSSSMSSTPPASTHRKEGQAKKDFIRRRKHSANKEADSEQEKVLKGMTEIAKERDRADKAALEQQASSLRPKKWDEALEKPNMNYGEIFDDEVGQVPGLTVWEIENFYPNLLDEAFHGKFYEADCYIILKTTVTDGGHLDYKIYYWIGERCSLDKKACSAIHAVNLRNFLGATCRTEREEMNDESDDFIELFGEEIVYIEGGRTASGFYTIEQVNHPKRLYRVSPVFGNQIRVEPVPVCPESLDPRFVFLLDCGQNMFVWSGRKCKGVLRSKTRLFAEKVNKNERKGNSEIQSNSQGHESEEFWAALMGKPNLLPDDPIVEHVSSDFQPRRPILYHVCLGMGYLELPQIDAKKGLLRQDILQTKSVYILDCQTDIFMWIGKKSTRLVRAAGSKIAAELHAILHRPDHACVNRVCEGTESMLFKSKFVGWDDVIAVDFTRTADSVQRRGADLKVIMERDKMKTDLQALFLDRQQVMPDSEAEQLMEECNEDLEYMEPFVLEGKKFVRLPDHEYGIFYTMDCYVFLCRYWMPPQDAEEDEKGSTKEGAEEEPEGQDDFQCVVYFWQGRQASNMGWLTFTFSLQKKFESLFKDKLEVVRMYQQQENQKFLSHFKKKFVIRRGRRNLSMYPGARMWPELFHMRSNGSVICTRTIQVDNTWDQLNSEFCFMLKVPYTVIDDDGNNGRIYIWVGDKSKESVATAEEVANEVLNAEKYPVEKLTEGNEPEEFWDSLKGGKKAYDSSADFMRFSRLFRCTNEKGYFCVSEKTIDFCQDDLDDDDIMILDSGDHVFIWVGARASEVEVKLAYKAAQVYVQHMKLKQPERPRKLFVTLKGKESKRFTKCFHAWGKHKTAAGD